jgi:hypothetical protein
MRVNDLSVDVERSPAASGTSSARRLSARTSKASGWSVRIETSAGADEAPVTQPRGLVRKRGCSHTICPPHPARQLHKHMIAPAGALPVDHWKPLTEERMGAVSNRDLSTGSSSAGALFRLWFAQHLCPVLDRLVG